MPLNFIVPKVGKYKKNTKDLIVSVLALEYPLNLRKITNTIKRNFTVSVTYQAVRKAVNDLIEEGVLVKEKKEYSINKQWILDSRAFIDRLQKRYLEEWKPLEKVEVGENVIVYTVKNLVEVERLWGELLLGWVKNLERGKTCLNTFQITHLWLPIGHLQWEEKQLEEMKKKGVKSYALVYSDTFLDRIAVKFYRDFGIITKIIKDKMFNRNCEIGTYGDMIIQTYWPEEITQAMEEYFTSIKRIEDVNLERLMEIAKIETDIKVTVLHNPQIARQIQDSVMKHFNKKYL